MRTPGRCTNVEGCWISASHRNVWLSIGEEFVCPNCGGNLSAPLPETRSFRAVKRAATFGALGAVASVGLVAVGLGTVKLSTVAWPGRSVAAAVVQAPAALLAVATGAKPIAPTKNVLVADDEARLKPLTPWAERKVSLDVLKANPTSPFSLEGISGYNANQLAARRKAAASPSHGANPAIAATTSGPLMLYTAGNSGTPGASTTRGADEQHAESMASDMRTAPVTTLSEATLSPTESLQAPVITRITFGEPPAPETDVEPIIPGWHHHGIVSTRHSGFLPAAPVAAKPASADAIAQICRIPSLLH